MTPDHETIAALFLIGFMLGLALIDSPPPKVRKAMLCKPANGPGGHPRHPATIVNLTTTHPQETTE